MFYLLFHFFFFGVREAIKCLNPHPPGGLFAINFDRDIKPTFTTKLVWWCLFSTVHQHFLCFSMWVQRSFQCIIQISTIQEKVKNAGVFNVQFTKENLRSYLPLTPMPKGHSDSIDDNLPAYLLYFIQRHASTSRYSISVQMHGFTCPYSFFLSNVRYRCPIALLSVLF